MVAVVFALMAIPFIALGGWAVDYVRIKHVQDYLQTQADAAALNALVGVTIDEMGNCLIPNDYWEPIFDAAVAAQYQGSWASNVFVEGECLNDVDYQVVAKADVPLAFIKLMPGIPDSQTVWVAATARLVEPKVIQEAPEFTELDPEAGDYNRLYLYCYWPGRIDDPSGLPIRTQMVPIADNGGSTFIHDEDENDESLLEIKEEILENNPEWGLNGQEDGVWERKADFIGKRQYMYFMPDCDSTKGAYMSYRLLNVRGARTSPYLWDAGGDRYNYYTDTRMTDGMPDTYDGLETEDGQKVSILETVLCDTIDECVAESEGGVIPRGRNRTPERATEPCSENKYMYYGWEDRPPGIGAWTDEDYDDIRVIIKCPVRKVEGERNARLVS